MSRFTCRLNLPTWREGGREGGREGVSEGGAEVGRKYLESLRVYKALAGMLCSLKAGVRAQTPRPF